MDFWRRSARLARKDKIRNTIIKQKMNVTRSLLDDINTKQPKWYGHIQRMEEGRLPKQAMKWNPPGRRTRGRPKLTWAEGIRGLKGGKRDWWKKTGMTETNGERRYYKCSVGAGRCGNVVQPAK